jgi:BON domain
MCKPGRLTEAHQAGFTMKTNAQLQKDVMEEIKWQPCVTRAEIAVSAADGVVTLNGTVRTCTEKWAVERSAQRVEGVKAIVDKIKIKPVGMHAKNDSETAAVAVPRQRQAGVHWPERAEGDES